MNQQDIKILTAQIPQLADASQYKACCWLNPNLRPYAGQHLLISPTRMEDAQQRLERFAPFLLEKFPETAENGGLIESPLREIGKMQAILNHQYNGTLPGKLLLKMDSHLPIAGSVKARGGIYEILKHAETIALQNGLVKIEGDYRIFASANAQKLFSQYNIHVGSTGNLGLSIGMISAALGFRVTVHMSADAKQWKKDLLRQKQVSVVEYAGDYSEAVQRGRAEANKNPSSYFVDDENSVDLFLGYAVAASRLKEQLKNAGISIDQEHPLFVYLPCGIGGAPSGITYGLKSIFRDHVHCFFVEPTHACCMLLGMATGLHDQISVQDFGIDGVTHADGLAVGRPSSFAGKVMEGLLSGICTVQDANLFEWMRDLMNSEHLFIEPSACAAFAPASFSDMMEVYYRQHGIKAYMKNAVHIAWATGGSMVPEEMIGKYRNTFL